MKKKIILTIAFVISINIFIFPQNGKELFEKGKELYNNGKYNDALAYLDKAYNKDSTLAEIPIYRGLANFCLNKYDEVKKDLKKAEILNSKNPEILNKIANLKITITRPDLIPDICKTAKKDSIKPHIDLVHIPVTTNPELHLPPVPEPVENKIIIRFKGAQNSDSQYEELKNLYDKAISIKPDFAEAYYDRGFLEYIYEKYESAISDFDKAIEINQDYENALYSRNEAMLALKKNNKDPKLKFLELRLKDSLKNDKDSSRKYLKDFCDAITIKSLHDSDKVKIFVDWICDYLEYDLREKIYREQNGKVIHNINWVSAILNPNQRTICYGYADLLCAMCRTQNIKCDLVIGYSPEIKNFKDLRDIKKNLCKSRAKIPNENHAWCIVLFDNGHFALIDPTWIDGSGEKNNYEYYNADPYCFVRTHLPECSQEKAQLIAPPLKAEDLSSPLNTIKKYHKINLDLYSY